MINSEEIRTHFNPLFRDSDSDTFFTLSSEGAVRPGPQNVLVFEGHWFLELGIAEQQLARTYQLAYALLLTLQGGCNHQTKHQFTCSATHNRNGTVQIKLRLPCCYVLTPTTAGVAISEAAVLTTELVDSRDQH